MTMRPAPARHRSASPTTSGPGRPSAGRRRRRAAVGGVAEPRCWSAPRSLAVGGVAFAVGRSDGARRAFAAVTCPIAASIVHSGRQLRSRRRRPRAGFALGGGLAIDGTVTAIDGDS